MASRTQIQQTKHNRKVEEIANKAKMCWAIVRADHINGYQKPSTINGHIPDIHLISGSNEKIIEVETPESRYQDGHQHAAFQRYANSKPCTTFEIVIAH